jgi:hypothetical protein
MCGFYTSRSGSLASLNNPAAWAGISFGMEMNMPILWNKDADTALAEARDRNQPVLLDFSAAPM